MFGLCYMHGLDFFAFLNFFKLVHAALMRELFFQDSALKLNGPAFFRSCFLFDGSLLFNGYGSRLVCGYTFLSGTKAVM